LAAKPLSILADNMENMYLSFDIRVGSMS